MKDITFETQLIAANPSSGKTNSSFVKEVMKKITPALPKRSPLQWLQQMHKPALALTAFVAIVLLGSAVYAAVHFAPALIQLLGKETNTRGATEYSIGGFADCATNRGPAPDRFEVKAGANLNDDEVQKIIQAKCELQWVQDFPSKIWPTTGSNAKWKDGDTIYYTRVDMLGTFKGGDDMRATIDFAGNIVDHTPPQGEKIRAFAAGEEIAFGSLKPGDTVFTISRVSETYHDMSTYMQGPKDPTKPVSAPDDNMKVVGAVGLFKMSLPYKYYMEMQQYVTEIPTCAGNEGELCPNTASIDIYPRAGGEGATNPYSTAAADQTFREISGSVTALNDDTITIKSRKGNAYTITVGDAGFKVYNRDYVGNYTDVDATLKIGSTVAVRYTQPKNADPKTVTKEQVQRVSLQLESLNIKKGAIKQY